MDINAIYKSLPPSLQNLALTFYGFKQYRVRYAQELPDAYCRTDLHGEMPFDELRVLQELRFGQLIAHAAAHVPYYKALFKKIGKRPSDITLSNFHEYLPVLSKAEIIAEPGMFHSSYYRKDALSLFTSGTSGSPMPIKCSPQARAINYAFYRSLLLKHGCDVRDRSATFAGRILLKANERSVFVRKDFYNKTLYLSSYHINETSIGKYVQALEEWNPQYIDSYPSAIGLIADYINKYQIKTKLKPKFILTSSETLTDRHRESIAIAFGCKVIDHYGCSEMAVSASSDAPGCYRMDSLYSLVEFLTSAVPGSHTLVCTGLINFAMPLIRYSIGDVVNGVESSPLTPFYNQAFGQIVGREDDVIITSDGRKIGRMDPVFKGISGILQAQIVQQGVTDIEVLVVPTAEADQSSLITKLVSGVRERTSTDMAVAVRFVDAIPLSKSGKFKSVVSKVSQA